MPLDDDADDKEDEVGAEGAAEIGALATGAAELALVALLPQSPPNGE